MALDLDKVKLVKPIEIIKEGKVYKAAKLDRAAWAKIDEYQLLMNKGYTEGGYKQLELIFPDLPKKILNSMDSVEVDETLLYVANELKDQKNRSRPGGEK